MRTGRFYGGIGALVYDPAEGRYLLLKRSEAKDFARGVWECVTGRVDQGEGFEDAVRREVQEELGVSVQVECILGTTHFYRGKPEPENELIGVVYLCSIADPGAISISEEHSEYRWVSAMEAKKLLTAADASTQWSVRVIERAEAVRRLIPEKLMEYYRRTSFELG
jgi:8-oxo-dGTP diphosphatase